MSDQRKLRGNRSNTFGSVMNTSSAPAEGSMPKLNTAGKIMTPASTATKVLISVTCQAVACILVSFEK